jgi:hypothetical protein
MPKSHTRAQEDIVWLAVPLVRGKGGQEYRGAKGVSVYELEPVLGSRRATSSANRYPPEAIRNFKLRYKPTPDDPIACDSTLLDLKGIAAWTRYDKSQLTRLINKSNLPFMTFDGKKWFLLHDVQHWFTKQVAERKVRGAQRGRIKFNQYCGNAGPLIWFNPPDAR